MAKRTFKKGDKFYVCPDDCGNELELLSKADVEREARDELEEDGDEAFVVELKVVAITKWKIGDIAKTPVAKTTTKGGC